MVPVYPAVDLTCAEAPTLPIDISGQTVGKYILELNAAYQDCHDTLQGVKDWVLKQKDSK